MSVQQTLILALFGALLFAGVVMADGEGETYEGEGEAFGKGDGEGEGKGDGKGDGGGKGKGKGGCAEAEELADEYQTMLLRSQISINAVKALYNTSVLGNCQQYTNALAHSDAHLEDLLSPLVTPTAKGRIHPLGFFNGSAALVEYFMLACQGGSAVLKINFRHIQAVNDLVFFDVDFWFGLTSNPGVYLRNLTHVGWARVNDNGQVCALKANFQRLEINDRVLPPLASYPTAFAAHNASIYSSCTTIQSRCTGVNTQYATFQDCVNYLSSINGGGYSQGDQKSLQCVDLHTILTNIRPDVHCAHVGPTGGGKCVPHPQAGFYVQDEELHC